MGKRTGALRHVHRYMRTRPRNEIIWKCMLPGCTHFIPLNVSVIGRNTMCWQCSEVFVFEEHNLEEEMPKCFKCSNRAEDTGSGETFDIEVHMRNIKRKQKEEALKKELELRNQKDQIEVIEPEEKEND